MVRISLYSVFLVRLRVIYILCWLCRMKQKEVYQVALYLGAGNNLIQYYAHL